MNEKIKNIATKSFTIFFWIILGLLLANRIPTLVSNFKSEGQKVSFTSLKTIEEKEIVLGDQKKILVFWATWCGPCKVELSRLNDLVKDGIIKKNQIIAVSLDDSLGVIYQYLKKEPLNLEIVWDYDQKLSSSLSINQTPTLLFIEKDLTIKRRTTGISPLLSMKTKSFLTH